MNRSINIFILHKVVKHESDSSTSHYWNAENGLKEMKKDKLEIRRDETIQMTV